MRRLLCLLATVTVASLALTAGVATANHVSCGAVITQDTTLDSDLLNCPGDGVVIGAPNVRLDLGGHLIDGPDPPVSCCDEGPDGVNNRAGHDGVTIVNGRIQEFNDGVSIGGFRIGIGYSPSSGNVVRDLAITSNVGIAAAYADNASLEHNSLTTRKFAIGFVRSSFGTIAENNTDSVPPLGHGAAILVFGDGGLESHHDLIIGNVVRRGDIDFGGYSNTVARNSVLGGLDAGIGAIGSGNVVAKNVVKGNTAGIISFGDDNLIEKNELTENGGDGIRVERGRSVLSHNITSRNGDDGIEVRVAGVRVGKNRAEDNGDLGIVAVPGVIDDGGNKASGNGNPLQCVNVSCK